MTTSDALEDCHARSDRGLRLALGVALGLHAVCFAGLWRWPSAPPRSTATAPTVITLTMAALRPVSQSQVAVAMPPILPPPHQPSAPRRAHRVAPILRSQPAARVPVMAAPVMPAVASAAVATESSVADMAPVSITRTFPAYPTAARRRGLQGVVVVTVEVDANGATQSVVVRSSSGHAVLDSAAINAVRTWRFAPARRGGHAVPAAVQVPIRFRLAGDDPPNG